VTFARLVVRVDRGRYCAGSPKYGTGTAVERAVRALSFVVVIWLAVSATSPALAQNRNPPSFEGERPGVDFAGVIANSMNLLVLEHAGRIAFQSKTREELGGPFWLDYHRSVKMPDQWGDTDAWWVNYIGHPIHGAAAGYIWIDHDPHAPADITFTRSYWSSRAKATAWAAGFSLQFEIGPISEASIGNVGMRSETVGWVDHVVTPLGAFGLIVAEDALDRYLVKWMEERTDNRVARTTFRILFNPARALSNTVSGRMPWHRAGRALNWR